MIRIAICDDDLCFTGRLETLIGNELASSGIKAPTEVFFDGDTLLKNIAQGNQYDLIFLDIEMQKVNGIDAARQVRGIDKTVLLVYISGYDQYLKELFEVEPFRFLSKPLDEEIFCRYIWEAIERIGEAQSCYQFSFNKEIKKVPLKDILYFESKNRVISIHLKNGLSEQFYEKLNVVEEELCQSGQLFLRIHQSFLVNYYYIQKMNFSCVLLSAANGKKISLSISEDRQKAVRTQLCKIAARKAVIQ